MKDFSERYRIIYDFFKKQAEGKGLPSSKLALADSLGVSQGRMQKWEKGQCPNAMDCLTINKKLGFSFEWLATGEGEALPGCFGPREDGADKPGSGETGPVCPEAKPCGMDDAPAIPVFGLVACDSRGLGSIVPYAAVALPLCPSPEAVAILPSASNMLPAGIGNGYLCFCDPAQKATPGEAVFLKCADNTGSLMIFQGNGDKAGTKIFKSWLSNAEGGPQEPFVMQIEETAIEFIAPVILVRRRL